MASIDRQIHSTPNKMAQIISEKNVLLLKDVQVGLQ